MKVTLSSWSLLLLLCAATAHAELYKWVGPDGKVTYSDTPPPPSVTRVEKQGAAGGGSAGTQLPYELAELAKGSPVILYTTPNCPACDDGRKLLNARGIPFTEKTVTSNDDVTQLKQAGGETRLPFLTIGRQKQQGFESEAWNHGLTVAGYPETSKLPKNYRNPQAEPAAPRSKAMASKPEKPADIEKNAVRANSESLPAPAGNAPPGFRF